MRLESGWCRDCGRVVDAGHQCGSGTIEIAGLQVDATWTIEAVVCPLPRCVMCEMARCEP